MFEEEVDLFTKLNLGSDTMNTIDITKRVKVLETIGAVIEYRGRFWGRVHERATDWTKIEKAEILELNEDGPDEHSSIESLQNLCPTHFVSPCDAEAVKVGKIRIIKKTVIYEDL